MKIEIRTQLLIKNLKEKFLQFFAQGYLQDLTTIILMATGGILIFALWIVAIFRFPYVDFQVPVRYNSFLGVTELGGWYKLFSVPFFVLICYFLNIFLANVAFKKDKMVSYIFLAINIFIAIIALAVVINLSILLES